MPGLNGKLSEVVALVGQLRLADYDRIVAHRAELFAHYRAALPELQFQPKAPGSQAHQFVPALLPTAVGRSRATIRTSLADQGIATGAYFCPHLFEQPYFQKTCVAGRLPVCDDVSARIISLPLFDEMTHEQVDEVVARLRPLVRFRERTREPQKSPRIKKSVPLVYTVASRTSRRRRLTQAALDTHVPTAPARQQGQI
jgi:dTDP-4-amino-4,6-dideoxygalactose transaminase